jgi:ferric enterobactin receptor
MFWAKLILTSLFCLLLHLSILGQENEFVASFNELRLDKVFKQLSSQDMKFTYDSRAVKKVFVTGEFKASSKLTLVQQILEGSGFSVKQVRETFVVYPAVVVDPGDEQATRAKFTLSGKVIDSETGESLPFANVFDPYTGKGVSTNRDGHFTIHNYPSDTSMIHVSFVGYRTLEIKLSPSRVSEGNVLSLAPDRAMLSMVPVYAEQPRMLRAMRQMGLHTMDANLAGVLPNNGEADVLKMVQMLPGVSGTSESSSGLNVRGGNSDETLVMYDGFTVYHVDHFYGIFSAFNSQSIKNVRLHKGWSEAKYGGRASSVVEITGKDGSTTEQITEAQVNLTSANVMFQTPIVKDNTSLLVAARRSYTDIIFSPLYRKLFNNLYNSNLTPPGQSQIDAFESSSQPSFYFYDITARVTSKPNDKDLISATFYNGQDQLGINYESEYPELKENVQYNDDSQWGNVGYSARWSRKWSESFYSNLSAGFSRYKSELNALDRTEELLFNSVDTVFSNEFSELQDLSLKWENEIKVEDHKVGLGMWFTGNDIDYEHDDSESGNVSDKMSSNLLAIYAQDEIELDNWLFQVGLRMSYYSGTTSVYNEPRVAVSYRFLDDFTLKAAYGRSHQMIRRIRRQNLYLNTPDFWRLSNLSNIPVLRSDQFALGASWEKGQTSVHIDAFYRDLDGVFVDPLNDFSLSADELPDFLSGEGEAYGVDVLFQQSTGRHSGWLGYSLLFAENTFSEFPGLTIPADAEQRHELKLTYLLRLPRWQVSAFWIYGSGRPFTPVLGTYSLELVNGATQQLVVYGNPNSQRLPEYHRLDLSATYTFQWGGFPCQAGISLYNVYDRNNARDTQYFVAGDSGVNQTYQLESRSVQMLGFSPSIHFKITL